MGHYIYKTYTVFVYPYLCFTLSTIPIFDFFLFLAFSVAISLYMYLYKWLSRLTNYITNKIISCDILSDFDNTPLGLNGHYNLLTLMIYSYCSV